MPRTYSKNAVRVAAILNTLPGTQKEIHLKTGISQGALSRWLERLTAERKVHVHHYIVVPHGGPLCKVYALGPKPEGFRPRKPEIERDPVKRKRIYINRKRRDGTYETDILLPKRNRWAAARPARVDLLTSAFFGVPAGKVKIK